MRNDTVLKITKDRDVGWYLQAIASRLEYTRIIRGYTRKELSELSGLHQNTIYNVESGSSANLETIFILASTLGVPWDRLVLPVSRGRLLMARDKAVRIREEANVDESLGEAIDALREVARASPVSSSTEFGNKGGHAAKRIDPWINWDE